MPPPKKPKTGLSRVEEFLTASEKEELASQGSVSSPDRTSPSQTELLSCKGLFPSSQHIDAPSSLEECLSTCSNTATQEDYYYNSCLEEKVKRQYNEEPYIRRPGGERFRSREALNQYCHENDNAEHYDCNEYSSRLENRDKMSRDHCDNSQHIREDQTFADKCQIITSHFIPIKERSQLNLNTSQVHPSNENYEKNGLRNTSKDFIGLNNNSVYSSMNVTGKGRLTEMMKARKVDALFHALQPESPPPSIESIYSPQQSPVSEIRPEGSPTYTSYTWKGSSNDQDAPLDFSLTAKSVLEHMMTDKDCNIQLAKPQSTPPLNTPSLIHTASNRDRSQRLLTSFLEQPIMPSTCNLNNSCDSSSNKMEAWLPPSEDSRSLSPGEWRPGMPPFAKEQNYEATLVPSISSMHYQDSQGAAELPPFREWNSQSISYTPPSGEQNWDKECVDKLDAPSSGGIHHWEADDDIMVEKESITSTSNTTEHQKDSSSNTTQEQPTSTMDEPKVGRPRYMDKNLSGRRCQICNDMASGFHYGVWSCEGCKAFFKRSLQGTPVDYVCPATNSCTIDKHRRKSCQACRLRKCIEQGMNRGKKGPRGPRGPNKRKHMEAVAPSAPVSEGEPQIKIKKEVCSEPLPIVPLLKTDECSTHPLTEYLMKIDPQVRQAGHDNSLPDTELSIMISMMKLADAELVDVINWAKSIPGYTDLELRDRIHLLEACWMEILLMGLLWRSFPHCSDEVLLFAPDLHINRKRAEISGMGVLYEKLLGLSTKFASLQLHKEEFVLLRTLLLFNAEVALLPSISKIESLREKLVEALQYTSCQRLHRNPERVSHLLLFLPHIRQCSLSAIAHMYTVKKEKSVPGFELLQEMLEARSPIPMPPVMQKRLFDNRREPENNLHHSSQDLHINRPSNIPASPPLAMSVPAHFSNVTSSQPTDSSGHMYRSQNQLSLQQPRSSVGYQHNNSTRSSPNTVPVTSSNNMGALQQYSYPASSPSTYPSSSH